MRLLGSVGARPAERATHAGLWVRAQDNGSYITFSSPYLNLSSLTRNGVGDVTLTFANPFATGSSYVLMGFCGRTAPHKFVFMHLKTGTTPSANSVTVQMREDTFALVDDGSSFNMVLVGRR